MREFKFFNEKPILETMDGFIIYPNESFVSVNKCELYGNLKILPAYTIVERLPITKDKSNLFKQDSRLVYFKYLSNAKRYVSLKKKQNS